MLQVRFRPWGFASFGALLIPSLAWACACGCGIFDVGTRAMLPTAAGGMVFLEYDFLDQNQNRSLGASAASEANPDKEIRNHFVTAGAQYMFSRAWGARLEVPYWSRYFSTTDDSGDPASFSHNAVGDVRLNGIYTGLSEDMSTGFTFGLKLPTGDSTFSGFDPDTQIGSGSTDLLLGFYHLFKIAPDSRWNGFGQLNLDQPILSKPGYLPGAESDAALGAYYEGWTLGQEFRIAPILGTLFSFRGADSGELADPNNSGFRRLILAPGLEVNFRSFRIYGDAELPLYQYFNGNQLAAPVAYKLAMMYMF